MCDFDSRCYFAMLSSSASSSSAEIVKINSRPLEPAELKRLEKQEKECIAGVNGVVKGRQGGKAQLVLDRGIITYSIHKTSKVI